MGSHASKINNNLDNKFELNISSNYKDKIHTLNNNLLNKHLYYDKLILCGGGIKGISEIGSLYVIDQLIKNNIIITPNLLNVIVPDITSFSVYAGASFGAILSLVLSIGYDMGEVINLATNIDFTSFMNNNLNSFYIIKEIYTFFKTYGWCSGDKFTTFLESLFINKSLDPNITFKQLYDIRKNKLVIVGTNLSKMESTYFSTDTYPNMMVKTAVRLSMSIPFVFTPVSIPNTLNPSINDIYVDGGMLDNYPLEYFDKKTDDGEVIYDDQCLGIRIINNKYENFNNNVYTLHNTTINNIKEFTGAIMNTYLYAEDVKIMNKMYWTRTIGVTTNYIPLTQFSIDNNMKTELIENGIEYALIYFNKFE